jgi:hypothetical protein
LHPGGQDEKTSARIAFDPFCSFRQFPEWLGYCSLWFPMFGGTSPVKTQNMCRKENISLHLAIKILSAFGDIIQDDAVIRYKTKESLFQR